MSTLASFRSLRQYMATIVIFGALTALGCSHFPESSFILANESRLPKWFALKPGETRADVKVTMDYYSDRTVTFTLTASSGRLAQKVIGQSRGLHPLKRKVNVPGFAEGYPLYEVISVGGQTEIIEHRRMEPKFYVSDDPEVRAEFGEHG